MAITTSTISASGFASQVHCDYCPATAPKADHADRARCQRAAVNAAEDEGFVPYRGGKLWCCPACRIRRLPDRMKALLPGLCAEYGIPLPMTEAPTQKRKSPGKKRLA